MKSPRFDIRAASLRRIFTAANIERVWKDKVRLSMRQQYLSDGIENFDFHVARRLESEKLSRLVLSGLYVPQKGQRILVEKSKGLCRQLVLPSVADAIVLQCLSDFLYSQIKDKAPSTNSFFEIKDHRFSSNRDAYGTFAAWLNFQKTLFNFSKNRKFIIVTDIANYYDSISYTHLRNVISSMTDAEECVLDMLIFVLSALLWQPDYMPRVEIGLPQMNLDAPRLLAHCFLYELDAYIAGNGDIDFVRYMDDIDIGVNTIVEAKQILKSVDLVLQTKQIRLNSGKTAIFTSEEAQKHFKIDENAFADIIKTIVDTEVGSRHFNSNTKKLISSEISKGLRRKTFNDGNGEKVLKRWIGLAGRTGASIPPDTIESLIRLRPSLRETLFSYIRRFPLTPARARVLANCLGSNLLIDDAANVDLVNNLVETMVKTRRSVHDKIVDIINHQDTRDYFGFYCKIWLQSKYDTPRATLQTIKRCRNIWIADERLGRLVGSLKPLFIGEEEFEFLELTNSAQNSGARAALGFQQVLSSEVAPFNAMFPSLENPNPSRGTGITHPKFLCLIAALSNPNASFRRRKKLRDANDLVFRDVYYRTIGRRTGVYETRQ